MAAFTRAGRRTTLLRTHPRLTTRPQMMAEVELPRTPDLHSNKLMGRVEDPALFHSLPTVSFGYTFGTNFTDSMNQYAQDNEVAHE